MRGCFRWDPSLGVYGIILPGKSAPLSYAFDGTGLGHSPSRLGCAIVEIHAGNVCSIVL